MQQTVEVQKDSGINDKTVTIVIETADEDREFTFDKNAKIQQVIDVAVNSFGLAAGNTYNLVFPDKPNEPLDKNRPLVSFGVKDQAHLVLTSVGGGV
jgi:hypothetical protein